MQLEVASSLTVSLNRFALSIRIMICSGVVDIMSKLYSTFMLCSADTSEAGGTIGLARLIILFRDADFGEDRSTVETDIKRKLFGAVGITNSHTSQDQLRTEASRSALIELFGGIENITVLSLPPPPRIAGSTSCDAEDSEFQLGISRLRSSVANIVRQPRSYTDAQGSEVSFTGSVNAELFLTTVDRLNTRSSVLLGADMMSTLDLQLVRQALEGFSTTLAHVLESDKLKGLQDPAVHGTTLSKIVSVRVNRPFDQKIRYFRSTSALAEIEAVKARWQGSVRERIVANSADVDQIIVAATLQSDRKMSKCTDH